jgi:threonine aldolase
MITLKTAFASDNTAGVCPEAWEAMAQANHDYAYSYGNDPWTERAANLVRNLFENDEAEIFFVFNGTAANSLALASCCQSYHSVICHELAHIMTDECGAPEFFSNGTKLFGAPGAFGKLAPQAIADIVSRRSDIHYPKPRVVSLTQSTELGTVYQVAELRAIHEVTQRLGLVTHMDGARLANALASLKASPAEATWKSGVDVLCFGGTKLGMASCEAVVFFDPDLAHEFDYRCKQAGQLASKMRFLAAAWVGVLQDGAWLKHAVWANRCARLLALRLEKEAGLTLASPVEANAVFVHVPDDLTKKLHERGWHFYNFIAGNVARLMCSWQTSQLEIEEFVRDVVHCQNESL